MTRCRFIGIIANIRNFTVFTKKPCDGNTCFLQLPDDHGGITGQYAIPFRPVHMSRRHDEDPFPLFCQFLCQGGNARCFAAGPGNGQYDRGIFSFQSRQDPAYAIPQRRYTFIRLFFIYDNVHSYTLSRLWHPFFRALHGGPGQQ